MLVIVMGQSTRAVVLLGLCLWSDQMERSTRKLLAVPASDEHDLPTFEVGSFITVEVEGLPPIGDLTQSCAGPSRANLARIDEPGRARRSGSKQRRPRPSTGTITLALGEAVDGERFPAAQRLHFGGEHGLP